MRGKERTQERKDVQRAADKSGSVMNILLIKQTSLGDVVHATAAIRSVRQAYPQARITALTSTTAADILRTSPDINDLLTFDRYRVKSDWWRHPFWTVNHFARTFSAVRKQSFDMAIDLQGSWKTIIFLWAARATRRYAKGRWWFTEHFHQPALHAIDEMGGVLALAGIRSGYSLPVLSVDGDAAQAVTDLLHTSGSEEKPIALLCPLTRWPTKNWPITQFVALAERLSSEFQVVFSGSREDRSVIDQAIAQCPGVLAINLAGQLSLMEFFALAARSDVVVTGDSLPMHVASAFDRPLVSLFGPTNEDLVGPRNKSARIIRADMDCQRCYRRQSCPRACIGRITIDEVRSAIQSVLGSQDPSARSAAPEGGRQ